MNEILVLLAPHIKLPNISKRRNKNHEHLGQNIQS